MHCCRRQQGSFHTLGEHCNYFGEINEDIIMLHDVTVWFEVALLTSECCQNHLSGTFCYAVQCATSLLKKHEDIVVVSKAKSFIIRKHFSEIILHLNLYNVSSEQIKLSLPEYSSFPQFASCESLHNCTEFQEAKQEMANITLMFIVLIVRISSSLQYSG